MRVEFEAELAVVPAKLELAREGLERLRIARETVAEVLAEMTPRMPAVTVDAGGPPAGERVAWRMRGAERRVIGVLTVSNWQPGMGVDVLPRVYRDIVEVVADAPGRSVPSRSCPGSGCRPRPGRSRARGRS